MHIYLVALVGIAFGLVACQPEPIEGWGSAPSVAQPQRPVTAAECNLIPSSTKGYKGGLWVPKDAAGRRVTGQIQLRLLPKSHKLGKNTVVSFSLWRVDEQGRQQQHPDPIAFQFLNVQDQTASDMMNNFKLDTFEEVAPNTRADAVFDHYVLSFRSIGRGWQVLTIAYYEDTNSNNDDDDNSDSDEDDSDDDNNNEGRDDSGNDNEGDAADDNENEGRLDQASTTGGIQAWHHDDILLPPFAAELNTYQQQHRSPYLLNLHPLLNSRCAALNPYCWQQAAHNLCVHRPSLLFAQRQSSSTRVPASVVPHKKTAPTLWARLKAFVRKIIAWF